MSQRSTVFKYFDQDVRSNHRTQPDWIRCSSPKQVMECWDQAVAGSRHTDYVSTFKPCPRRRSLPKILGDEVWR